MRPPLHTHSTLARVLELTCWTVCHRSLCGHIFESKNISHSVVESAGCASDRRRGRGGRAKPPRAVAAALCLPHARRVVVRRASRLRMHFVVAHV